METDVARAWILATRRHLAILGERLQTTLARLGPDDLV